MNTDTTPSHRPNKWARLKAKLRQAKAEAEQAHKGLQSARMAITIYREQYESACKVIDNQKSQIAQLITILENLSDRAITQREEIATLQRQAKGI